MVTTLRTSTSSTTENDGRNRGDVTAITLSAIAFSGFVFICIAFLVYRCCKHSRNKKSMWAHGPESSRKHIVTLTGPTTREESIFMEMTAPDGVELLSFGQCNEYQHDLKLSECAGEISLSTGFPTKEQQRIKEKDHGHGHYTTKIMSGEIRPTLERSNTNIESSYKSQQLDNDEIIPAVLEPNNKPEAKRSLKLSRGDVDDRAFDEPSSSYGNIDHHDYLITRSSICHGENRKSLVGDTASENEHMKVGHCLHQVALKLRSSMCENADGYGAKVMEMFYDRMHDEDKTERTIHPPIYENANQQKLDDSALYNCVDNEDASSDHLPEKSVEQALVYRNSYRGESMDLETQYDCMDEDTGDEPHHNTSTPADSGHIYENSYEQKLKSATYESAYAFVDEDIGKDSGRSIDFKESEDPLSIYENSYEQEKSSDVIYDDNETEKKTDFDKSEDPLSIYENSFEREASLEPVYNTMDDHEEEVSTRFKSSKGTGSFYENFDRRNSREKINKSYSTGGERTRKEDSDDEYDDICEEPIRLSHIYANLPKLKQEILRQRLGTFPPRLSHPPPPSLF